MRKYYAHTNWLARGSEFFFSGLQDQQPGAVRQLEESYLCVVNAGGGRCLPVTNIRVAAPYLHSSPQEELGRGIFKGLICIYKIKLNFISAYH